MSKDSRISHVSKKCRICLNDGGSMVNIFTVDLSPKIQELVKSTSIQINDGDNLPRNICHVCLYKLEMWCDFKKQLLNSNKILLEHLNSIDTFDAAGSTAKRRHDAQDNFIDDSGNKKFKSDIKIAAKPLQSIDNQKLKVESNVSSRTLPGNEDICDTSLFSINEPSTIEEEITTDCRNADGCQMKSSPITKTRLFTGRRTSEQRMASTQRWVARKKALLAATGEHDSDTDSVGSDNIQLSPIQKARSKSQQVEKEVERLTQLSNTINNFEAIVGNQIDDDTKKIRNDNKMINSNELTDHFGSHTIQSELVIGDTTFIVTSKLLSSEPQYLAPSLNNAPKMKISPDTAAGATPNEKQNIDIIEAVKLRRVNREKEKNFIERCLNIEVEGSDLMALQRIQSELDNYLMTDMKKKLLSNVTSMSEIVKVENNNFPQLASQDSFQTLEQQLKTIVEKTIKKNLEITKMRRVPISKIATSNNRGNKIFSAAFIKAAMKSQIFQPKVVLNRINPINNKKLDGSVTNILSYNDKNSEMTCYNKTISKNETMDHYVVNEKKDRVSVIGESDIDMKKTYFCTTKPNLDGGNYSCSICNELFATKLDIELHLKNHKYSTNTKTPINIISKRKMMRCKRCHEIVESRYVKTHICEWKKSLYRCCMCNATFKTEYLLLHHLKVHEEVTVEEVAAAVTEEEVREVREERAMLDEVKIERVENVSQKSESISFSADNNKNDGINDLKTNINITTYTCFVCDKNFTDEELLKDHLQEHCDDVSDDDNEKYCVKEKVYQCAICGETLKNETLLGYHVEKHLFDDTPKATNNKSLSNVQENDLFMKLNDELDDKFKLHACVQCNEKFDNEVNLALHVQGHEEDSAIAEWEKHRFIKGIQFSNTLTCTICDDTFDNDETLSHHIDVHNRSTHVCILCDKPFLTLAELQDHVNTH